MALPDFVGYKSMDKKNNSLRATAEEQLHQTLATHSAEKLLQLAEQYHCQVLADWATTLKTQAELFDLANLPKTLSFDSLISELTNL